MQRGGPLEAGLGPSGYREQILTRMFENPEASSINKIPPKKQDLLNLIYAVVLWSSTTNYEYNIYIYTFISTGALCQGNCDDEPSAKCRGDFPITLEICISICAARIIASEQNECTVGFLRDHHGYINR